MTSSDRPPEPTPPALADETRLEFAPELEGRRATCDGGAQTHPGSLFGARATFVGTLSGRRMLFGDPPWRWVELLDAIEEAEGTPYAQVWCDEACVFLDDER